METLSPLADRSLKTLEKVDNGLWKKSIRRTDTFRWVVEFPAERIWEKLDMSLADLMHIDEEWHTCKFRWMWRSPKKLYNPVEGYDGVMPLHPEHPHTEWMIETAAELQALAFQNRAASYWLDRLVWQMNTWGQCKAIWPAIVNYVPNWKREAIERLHKKSRLPDIDESLLECIKKGLSTVTDMALTQALLLPEGKERQITMLFEESKHPQARMHKG